MITELLNSPTDGTGKLTTNTAGNIYENRNNTPRQTKAETLSSLPFNAPVVARLLSTHDKAGYNSSIDTHVQKTIQHHLLSGKQPAVVVGKNNNEKIY